MEDWGITALGAGGGEEVKVHTGGEIPRGNLTALC